MSVHADKSQENKSQSILKLFKTIVAVMLLSVIVFSCAEAKKEEHPTSVETVAEEEQRLKPEERAVEEKAETIEDNTEEEFVEEPVIKLKKKPSLYPTEYGEVEKIDESIEMEKLDADDYEVKLGVDGKINMYKEGQLIVWIGSAKENHILPSDMKQDSKRIPADLGQYARITPYAPDFVVTPSEMKCIKIDPSGSEVFFSLKPNKIGTFKVSARIELYTSADCTGTPIPKTASNLSVIVETDGKRNFKEKLNEMVSVFWDKLLSFWGALLTIIFAFLIFIIRRKLKRKTGFDS